MAHEQGKAEHKPSRRQFVKKAAYVTPAILTLAVAPSYAKRASNPAKVVRPNPPPKVPPSGPRRSSASLTNLRVPQAS